jgi:hypothetical protein|tara:strand:- start:7121 stop:7732 length:612 start_codon:yes stop_codon:yes gene_type:complete
MKILQSDKAITKAINNIIASQAENRLKTKKREIRENIKLALAASLASSPEIASLSSGKLKTDFGLTENPSDDIISSVVSTIRLGINPVRSTGSKIKGGISLYIQPSSYSNLLTLGVAKQEIEDGGVLPWLSWLLTAGDNVLVANFGVVYQGGRGRSGGGYMSKDATPFRVDPFFSGVREDNFVTRAIDRAYPSFIKAIIGGLS